MLEDGVVVVDGPVVAWVGDRRDAAAAGYGAEVEAAGSPAPGRTVLPGLVELHNHGGAARASPTPRTPSRPLSRSASTAVTGPRASSRRS
ncbi:hypothetical protein NKG05_21870 [Oerskovia sp. M15]